MRSFQSYDQSKILFIFKKMNELPLGIIFLRFHVPMLKYPVRMFSIPCSCGNKHLHECTECMKRLCNDCSIHCDKCYFWICKDCEHEGCDECNECDNKSFIGCLECLDSYCSTCYSTHDCDNFNI